MSSPVDISCSCPSCGALNRLKTAPEAGASELLCCSCGKPVALKAPGAAQAGRPLSICAVCGDDKLYIRKDFNRKVGCLIVGAGAALVPWTYGLSLAVCALADWLLYHMLPFITVCYVCGAQYRRLPLNPHHAPFELLTAQTWEARTLTWRRLQDRSTD